MSSSLHGDYPGPSDRRAVGTKPMRNSGGSLLDTAVAPPPAGHLRLQATGPGGWEGPQSLCPYYTDGETEARGAKAPVQCHPAKAGLGPEFGGSQAWPVSAHLRVRGKLAWKEHREGEGRSPEPPRTEQVSSLPESERGLVSNSPESECICCMTLNTSLSPLSLLHLLICKTGPARWS